MAAAVQLSIPEVMPCWAAATPIKPPPGLAKLPAGLALVPPPGLEELGSSSSEEDSWMWDSNAALNAAQADFCSMEQAKAWWSLYKNLGGEQAPLMGMKMYDPAEPISMVSSDSSPTGNGQWWQRNSVDCKERDRFGSDSTMASLSGLTDEPSITGDEDDDDDAGTVILSDNGSNGEDADSEAVVFEDVDTDAEGCADSDELCGSASDDEREALFVASICGCLRSQLQPVIAEKAAQKLAAGRQQVSDADATAVLQTSDFPPIGAVQPHRRGGR